MPYTQKDLQKLIKDYDRTIDKMLASKKGSKRKRLLHERRVRLEEKGIKIREDLGMKRFDPCSKYPCSRNNCILSSTDWGKTRKPKEICFFAIEEKENERKRKRDSKQKTTVTSIPPSNAIPLWVQI